MAGKTISNVITHEVTLGSGVYLSPLTITTTGAIQPSDDGSIALYVKPEATLATVVNHGLISGAPGAFGYDSGMAGATAVLLASSTNMTNSGTVDGGNGGGAEGPAGSGGTGIDIKAYSTVTNSGIIAGGAGGYGSLSYGSPGAGGIGVSLETHAVLKNSGTIFGGLAGSAYGTPSYDNSEGGIAVASSNQDVISNSGFIIGGDGNVGQDQSTFGSRGGNGLNLYYGGALTNSGTIMGGSGGGSNTNEFGGYGGTGVYLIESVGSNTNTGWVVGGTGGAGLYYGNNGGYGVFVDDFSSFGNAGHIAGGTGGQSPAEETGDGRTGMVITEFSTASNGGTITGGNAVNAVGSYVKAGDGGNGVNLRSGALTNRGRILGGSGGQAPGDGGDQKYATAMFAGSGGNGVDLGYSGDSFGASMVNYGILEGGSGGYISGQGGAAGHGGYGANLASAGDSLVNHGTIIGGGGGSTGQAAFGYGYAGVGGNGVVIGLGAQATNTGTIIGGAGGSNIYLGTIGGAGVVIDGGIFIDSGAVRGGPGGFSQGPGSQGDAIDMVGTVAGTLVLDPGASFSGEVVAQNSLENDVLVVAGTSSVALTGIGSEFIDFETVSFATGAVRTIEGSISALHVVAGFAQKDAIVVDSFTSTLADNEVTGDYIILSTATGYMTIETPDATAKDFIITDGTNGKTTITGAVGSQARSVGVNSEQIVAYGGISTGTTLVAGGREIVENGGTASGTHISGGKFQLDIGAKIINGISFSTVKGGQLTIDSVVMPTATISGFVSGDTIALAGIAYNPNDSVLVTKAGVVTIKTPDASYNLDIAGATVGETDFRFGAGSLLTRTAMAPAAMGFISPDKSAVVPNGDTPMAPLFGVPARLPSLDNIAFTPASGTFGSEGTSGISGLLTDLTKHDEDGRMAAILASLKSWP